MRERSSRLEREMLQEIERVRRSLRAEIVPYGAYEPDGVRIPVARARRRNA
jgi:hypothetical protein